MTLKIFSFLVLTLYSYQGVSQIVIKGDILDSNNDKPLAYVNIGIQEKNVGTASLQNGSFSITISSKHLNDTLTFSLVGYHPLDIPINRIGTDTRLTIPLIEKIITLEELVISDEKLILKKYGIKKRGLIHFTDGIFKNNDSFEIGQLINLGNKETQVTTVNLHINKSRQDSASFRINFYGYNEDDNRPGERIVEKNIMQRHPIQEGWLKFDLTKYTILLKGKVFVSIEFIPEHRNDLEQIYYEVKIGGTSKSFFRRNSLGQWSMPPHHYCLYVTALADKNTPEEPDDAESTPTITLLPDSAREAYSIFVRLPKGYVKNTEKKYPVIYHLDGNAFFDPVSSSVDRLIKKKKILRDPILVGIGYENAYIMDSLRDRDYTFPEALPKDSFQMSGGGKLFFQFIQTKLKPFIEKTYRTDTTHQTIMGHSLGGYFVLYALLEHAKGNRLFNNYVAASPSLWYHDKYMLQNFHNLSHHDDGGIKSKLYVTMGELEIAEDHENSFKSLSQILSHQNLQLKVKIYDSMEHMGTAVPSFEDGMEFILSD